MEVVAVIDFETTGLTDLARQPRPQQDFAAKILADNLSALLSGSGTTEVSRTGSRPNRTDAFGALKPVLAGRLLGIAHAWASLPDTLAAIARGLLQVAALAAKTISRPTSRWRTGAAAYA